MDTSDPAITFDAAGVCSHCRHFDAVTRKHWYPNEEGARRWEVFLDEVRAEGRGGDYDCVIGLSGGVDSSYLALKCADWGLRPLVVHVDAGWNSELAVANIERLLDHGRFDLHTLVVDWEEMRDLHLAFLQSGIANQDVPQDHAIFAGLYHHATRHGIRTVLSGGNIATESVLPKAWHGSAMDAINLRAIHGRHGGRPLRRYRTVSFFDYYLWYPFAKGMRTLRPLNYMSYRKDAVVAELESRVGWRAYGRKHGESLFTKLFQNHYLPLRFGYDKRRPHLSSLILSGQLARAQAQEQLQQPLYDPQELEIDLAYLCKKLRISRAQWQALMDAPLARHDQYPTWDGRYRALKVGQAVVQRLTGRRFNVYS
jgi:aminotransferase